MITMSLYAKIRRMHFREKMPISEIARKTSLSRNTIKKWLKAPLHAELKYERRKVPSMPMHTDPSAIDAHCWVCFANSRPRAIPAAIRV